MLALSVLTYSPFRACLLGAAGEGENLIDELVIGNSIGIVDYRWVSLEIVIADGFGGLEFHILTVSVIDLESGCRVPVVSVLLRIQG